MPDRPLAPTTHLVARADDLRSRARWDDAAHVYRLAQSLARFDGDTETLMQATLLQAFCHRMQRDFAEAASGYSALRDFALSCGSVTYELEAFLGQAKLLIDRGDLAGAASAIDAILERARSANDHTILGKALLDRSTVYGMQGQIPQAIRCADEALRYTVDERTAFGIAINLGEAHRRIGRKEQAYRLALTVQQRGHDHEQKVAAAILSLHLAIDDGNQVAFEGHRRLISGMTASPALQAETLEALARGYHHFGQPMKARKALRQMLDICEREDLRELQLRGRAMLTATEPAEFTPLPLSADDAEIVDAVQTSLDQFCVAALAS